MEPIDNVDPDPVVEAYKKDVDRTLIRENLKLTVEERFRKAMALARFADELRRAGQEARAREKDCQTSYPGRSAGAASSS
jgi:hypothetical protein